MTGDVGEETSPPARRSPWDVVLRTDGVATLGENGFSGEGFVLDPQGHWRPLVDDNHKAVEDACVRLHDALAERIFGSFAAYWAVVPMTPVFVTEAGLNSESTLPRDLFEQIIARAGGDIPELNRLLYLYDCRMLVSSIQECTKEVSQLTGEFYRALNLDPFFAPGPPAGDDVRWTSSPTVTYLTAILGFIYIRMHSLLDYLAKLARETDSLRSDFTTYPRLSSANFLFGDRRRLSLNGRPGTVFDPCDLVDEIETVRNRLIHDGLLDDMPKAYEVSRAGKVIERFVLMPDRTGRQFDGYRNRRLFYSKEDKISLRLATLVREFHGRQAETLRALLAGPKSDLR